MEILIPGIPPATTREELYELVKFVLTRDALLHVDAEAQVKACEVVKIQDSKGVTRYYGRVDLASAKILRRFKKNYAKQYLVYARESARDRNPRVPGRPSFSDETE